MQYRIEEISTLARLIYNAIKRDLADFKAFSPIFDTPFITDFDAKISAIEVLVLKEFYLAELKKITRDLYKAMWGVKDLINKLEVYLSYANPDDLSIGIGDFGINAVRTKVEKKDAEGLKTAMSVLLGNLTTDNMAVLTPLGFTAAKKTALEDLKTKIDGLNESQNLKMDVKEACVQGNRALFDEMDALMKKVLRTGKALYKFTNKEKLGDYTMVKLVSRIRHEVKHDPDATDEEKLICMVSGTVADKDLNGLEGANVTVNETGQTVETDEDGEFLIEVSTKKVSQITLTVTLDTFNPITSELTAIAAGGEVEINLTMTAATEPTVPLGS